MFQGSLSFVFPFQPAWGQHAGAQPEMTVLWLGRGPELLSRNLEITVRLLWIFLEQKYLLSYCLLTFFLLSLTSGSVCWTVCDTVDCSLLGSFVHGDSPDKNTGAGCHAFLQRIFPTHGSDQGLLHCRQILYPLSHQGSPWVCSLSLPQMIFLTQESSPDFLHCRLILYQLP